MNEQKEEKARKILHGRALDIDRSKNAEKITADFNVWKRYPNRSDLRHFDTKDRRQKSVKQLTTDSLNAVRDEPQRFFEYTKPYQHMMKDYPSTKEAVNVSFSHGTLPNIPLNQGSYKALYRVARERGVVAENNREEIINYYQGQGVDKYRAEESFNRIKNNPEQVDRILKDIKDKSKTKGMTFHKRGKTWRK